MIDRLTAQRMSQEAALAAAAEGQEPVSVWPEDIATLRGFERFCHSVPNLGTYTPAGFTEVPVDSVLPHYPYKWFFVDSSGLGKEGEPALTLGQFRERLKLLCERDGYKYHIGVRETGEFQVHVGLFVGAPNEPAAN